MPNSPHRSPSRGHSAGFLTFEAVITYPFHPLVGQTVLVVGDHEHDGIHHFLIRQPQGGFFQVPDWMFDSAVRTIAIVSVPRLPVNQLVLLRALVDRLIACPSGNDFPGGIGHGGIASLANGSVYLTGTTTRAGRLGPSKSGGPVGSATAGSGEESSPGPVSGEPGEGRQ